MILSTKQKLEDLIIKYLASHPASTAEQIQIATSVGKQAFSIQAIYKELRKLHANGVVVKAKRFYSLRLSWVLELSMFTEKMSDSYLNTLSLQELAPTDKSKFSWNFSNLLKMDDFFVHVLIALINNSKTPCSYAWAEHPWFMLRHMDEEKQYQRILKRLRKQQLFLINGDSFLDRLHLGIYDPATIRCKIRQSSFPSYHGNLFVVIDNYILSQKVPERTRSQIHRLYTNVKTTRDIDHREVVKILNSSTRIRVTLEHNESKAKTIKKRFGAFFTS